MTLRVSHTVALTQHERRSTAAAAIIAHAAATAKSSNLLNC